MFHACGLQEQNLVRVPGQDVCQLPAGELIWAAICCAAVYMKSILGSRTRFPQHQKRRHQVKQMCEVAFTHLP